MQFASAGAGSTGHIDCQLLNAAIGVNVTHVPYRGGGPAMLFFFKQKTAYDIGLGIPAEPLFRSTLFPILASLLVRLVVLLPFQLLRLSLATPSRWTPLALSVFLHCVVALLLTLL